MNHHRTDLPDRDAGDAGADTKGRAAPPTLDHASPVPRSRGRVLVALLSAAWLLAGLGAALDWAFPPDLSRLTALGTEIQDREGRPLALLPAPGGVWRFRATTDEVSPAFLNLLIRVEDRRFWLHPGVDPIALVRATAQMLRAGRIVSGGSTLAMQAARLLEPRPRTLRAKLIELARALQLEHRFGRAGVLEIWLTLAPYGGNLEGVRAGALAWFGVPASALEPAQAALLVAIPRRPEGLRPDRHPDAARRVVARIEAERGDAASPPALAGGGRREGDVSQQLCGLAPSPQPTPARGGGAILPASAPTPACAPWHRRALPRHAPQIVAELPRAPIVRTTLDLALQAALERLGQARLQTLPERTSLAILIADAPTRDIRAAFAGAWRDQDRAGALDLTRAVRSPGSALKPFIYALAFADGLAAPDTPLADLPRHFGAYAPENYDRGFAGTITAAEALQRSLNLPAVELLRQVGPLRFATTVRLAGARLRLPPGADPSLPLALGGVGITLRDAVALYAALASDGGGAPLRLTDAGPLVRTPFLPPAAAALVADVLTRRFPDDGPPGVAWKTGTSWGGRDAWAFGFDRRHVVGVWIGRPDGTAMPGATGARLALPTLAHAFDLLPKAPRTPAPRVVAPHRIPAVATDALRMLFPPPGAVLSADGAVTIRAMGGRRPLSFLVDGVPLGAEPARREARWHPLSPGFYRLTVLDADGAAVHAAVQVRDTP
jgi:penicillin-binding protein 1C